MEARRAMIQQEIRNMEEESRKNKSCSNGQIRFMDKVTTLERSLSWADIWQYEPLRLKSLLRSVYDVLPLPVNLCQWNLTDNRNYRLCEKEAPITFCHRAKWPLVNEDTDGAMTRS